MEVERGAPAAMHARRKVLGVRQRPSATLETLQCRAYLEQDVHEPSHRSQRPMAAYVPSGQLATHSPACSSGVLESAAQAVHAVSPLEAAKKPREQLVQVAEPANGATVPALHLVQLVQLHYK